MKTLDCDLSTLQLLGKGGNGAVYKLNPEQIIKVYRPGYTLEMIQTERERSKAAFLLGVPTAISFDVVEVGGTYGTIFELLNGNTLAQMINQDVSLLDMYTKKFAELVKVLHSAEVPDPIGPKLEKANITSKMDSIKAGILRQQSLSEPVKQRIIGYLSKIDTHERKCLHSDLHTNNVLVSSAGELMFIDMGDMSYGDPDIDIANMYKTYPLQGSAQQKAAGFSGLDLELFGPFVGAFNKYYFTDRQPDMQKIQLLMLVTTLMYLDSPYITEESRNSILSRVKPVFGE